MIITQLVGGLGNQLFQYALGKKLSLVNNVPLKLDTGIYKDTVANSRLDIRVYGLKHFNISATLASEEEVRPYKKYIRPGWIGRFWRVSNRLGTYYKKRFIVEPADQYYRFDKNLANQDFSHRDVYLRGYWQTEKYFKDIREELLKEFIVTSPLSSRSEETDRQIQRTNSISIHIRRGNNLNPSNPFGILPIEYYNRAIAEVIKKVEDPQFFVFSDDPGWVEHNLRIDFPTFFAGNDENKDYEDLRLMSHCKHHITANSTFSWWGAWLSNYKDKLVFVPPRQQMNRSTPNHDLYPEDWHIISC